MTAAGFVLPSLLAGGPAKIAVRGVVELVDTDGGGVSSDGTHCLGTGEYNDIGQGAEVVISDDAGKTLTITPLDQGTGSGEDCTFTFTAALPAAARITGSR